jgi:hypothetical protein
MRVLLSLFLVVISSLNLFSQGVKGKVTDRDNVPIPYSTIFVKEISMGTTSNSDGNYQIQLPPGTYTIQFQNLGFIPQTQIFEVGFSFIERDVALEEQIFQLNEIRIYAKNEDQAYPIMRRAISMAPYYRNQVQKYSADVYLKSAAKLEKVPKLLKKSFKVSLNGSMMTEGILYVGENISKITFEAPNVYTQKILSSNISMQQKEGETFNMELITSSAYEPELGNVILPLSPRAFSFYDFKYQGFIMEGKNLVNKIKVIPKFKSKQLVSGTLYIVEGLWCLHSLDIEFDQIYGNIKTRMQFAELRERVWLPISHNITILSKMMGVIGRANYTSSVKYTSIKLNEKLAVPH